MTRRQLIGRLVACLLAGHGWAVASSVVPRAQEAAASRAEESVLGNWSAPDGSVYRIGVADQERRSGTDLRAEFDPVAIGEIGDGARPLAITLVRPDGARFGFDEAYLDRGEVIGRRTLRTPSEMKQSLPSWVREELAARWAPQEWLRLAEASDQETGRPLLVGEVWNLLVTYSDHEIKRIHSPYATPIELRRGGSTTLDASGAGPDQLP